MSYVNAPIHDLLIRVKNAYMARRNTLSWIVYSRYKENVLILLQKYKFIDTYTIITDNKKKFITVTLRSSWSMKEDVPVVKFFSTPSRKWYLWWQELKSVAAGRWIGIISTNKGLMATHEAKALKLWGELIAEIY